MESQLLNCELKETMLKSQDGQLNSGAIMSETRISSSLGINRSYESLELQHESNEQEIKGDTLTIAEDFAAEEDMDLREFFNLTLVDLESETPDLAIFEEVRNKMDTIYPETTFDLLEAALFIENVINDPMDRADVCIRKMIGQLGISVEELKHGEVEKFIDKKEQAAAEVEKIHDFLAAMKACRDEKGTLVDMKEEPHRTFVDQMRTLFGENMFPKDLYTWKNDQIEALRESLFNKVQDKMAEVTMIDMRIANLLEQIKQILDSLRKIAEMEERTVEKTINKTSRSGG